jgi:hypothetical protein
MNDFFFPIDVFFFQVFQFLEEIPQDLAQLVLLLLLL